MNEYEYLNTINRAIAGDFPKNSIIMAFKGLLRLKYLYLQYGAFRKTRIQLLGQIKKVVMVNRENEKEFMNPTGQFWGFVQGGPLGAIIGGNLASGEFPIIFCACYLRNGQKFLARVSPQMYEILIAQAFDFYEHDIEPRAINPEINEPNNSNASTESKGSMSKGKIAAIVIGALFAFSAFGSLINSVTNRTPDTTINTTPTVVESIKNENISKTDATTDTTINASETIENGIVFNLSIANGAGVAGLAKKTAELFKNIKYPDGKDKYNVARITNADNCENTQIICKSNDPTITKAAEEIKTTLLVGLINTQIGASEDIDIIIGKDYLPVTELATETTDTEYKLVYVIKSFYRSDGANKYFLLINPINVSDGSFKDKIKRIISGFVEKYGNTVTVVFYDDISILEGDYECDKIFGVISDQEYLKKQGRHLIAEYDGNCSNCPDYLNSIYFFPAYAGFYPEIEKYIDLVEFNP